MKPILTRLFAGLFLLVAAQAYGQFATSFVVTSPGPAPSYPIGTHLVVELRVNGFTNVESMQFPIAFNKTALRFDSLSDAAFSNWNAGNYIGNNTAGKVGISWDGFSNGASMPFTFPDGTALFKLHFTVINNGTSVININPASAPPAIDVVSNGAPVIPTNFYQNGGTPTITLGTGNPPPPPLVGFKIVANTIYIPQGERACMPVTVNDFDNIVSMQWAMHWDNTKLNFECVRGFNLTGWSATDFNSTLTPGTLLAGWADPAGVGVTRADGVRIVDVCFKAIGAPGASTTITIDSIGFPAGNGYAEAYNSNSVNVWTGAWHPNGASGVSAPVNILSTPASSFDVTYTVDQVETAPNSVGCVEVKVKNFTNITSAEFALGYTPAQLSFNNNDFGSNPLNLQASNLVSQPANGIVKFQWSSANGATLADNTPIFKTCFTVLAPEGTTCPITFTSTACPSVTGFGTAKSTGGVPYANVAGWIKSVTAGPTINIVQEVTCNAGSNGSLTVVNPATLSATAYAWSSSVGTTQTDSNLLAGTYTVTVTYSNGTTATTSKTLMAPPAIVASNTTSVVSCFGGNNGAIDLTVSGGTPGYSYNWGGGITTEDRTNLTAGIYTVTITDNKGCTKTNSATVSGFIAINPTATVTNVTCAGLTNGAIALTVVGGAGNYSYKWSSSEMTKDLSNKAAGTYTVTITDGNNCTKTATAEITAPGPIAIQLVSKTDVKCANTPTGTAALSVTGGTGLLNFCWSDGVGTGCDGNGPNPTTLMPGTYTVVGTDVNGCTGTMANVTIANPPAPLTVQGTTTPSPCFDQPTGSIMSNGAGGWSNNYTYAWSGPVQLSPVPNHQPVPAGTYTVTVTDANSCTVTNSFVVGGAPEITQNASVTHVKCFGENNGAINLNLAGGNQPYQTVIWDNTTLLGQSISTLAPGSYQPTVTDAQGCTKIFPAITVNGPQILTIDTNIAEANPSNGSIDLEILSGGTPGFTYLWSNGANTQDINNLNPGNYTVTITDANNCVRTFTFEVKSGNVLGVPTVSSVKNSCDADGCIRINVASTAASFMPITLNWGFGTMQSSSLTPEICGLVAGVYNVTITASNGNSSVLSGVQVAQLDPASVNSNTTNPFSSLTMDGKITLTKALGVICDLQYQWGPAPLNSTSNQVSNLAQGTYFVTITNPCSGCVNIEEFTLEYSPINSVATVQSPMCAATADGSINHSPQGGNPPYDYAWTGPNGFTATTEDISGLEPGVYAVTTTDQDDRVELKTYTLTAQSPLNITNVNETSLYGPFQVSGATTCDGVATLAFIPGIGTTNIQWSNGVTTATNSTICGGAYSVTLTDQQGCTATWVDELTAPPAIALVSTEAPTVTCNGDCDGTAKVKIGGGVGPYSVRWSTGQFDPLVTGNGFSQAVNLCGGDYQITVTDDNDVQQVFTVTVPEPAPIVAEFAATAPRNFNSCDGDLLIELTGAVFPITYVWSGNFGHTGNAERAEELCSGEFVEYFITDANGCTAYFSDSIPYPEDGCFRVSPVITPGQQDGKNDFVVITCIETAFENTMEIYNRWGQLVFETENYTNNDADVEHNWNGLTGSGAVLAEGVYYYVLTFKYLDDQGVTREGTRKGAINLLR